MVHILQAGSPGVIVDADGNILIDNDAHREALEFYRAPLCEDKFVPENALEIGWGEAQNLFYQGQTAMMKFWAHAHKLTPETATSLTRLDLRHIGDLTGVPRAALARRFRPVSCIWCASL